MQTAGEVLPAFETYLKLIDEADAGHWRPDRRCLERRRDRWIQRTA